MNQQLGLNNLTEIKTHIQLLIKQEMPTESLLTLGREFTSGPVLAFADNKTFYFSGEVTTSVSRQTPQLIGGPSVCTGGIRQVLV